MYAALFVFLGGGLGSLSRYSISLLFNSNNLAATLISNSLASFIVGLLVIILQPNSPSFTVQRSLFIVGYCGGFSTFSTFTLETINTLKENAWLGIGNILANLVLSILFLLLGIWVANKIIL